MEEVYIMTDLNDNIIQAQNVESKVPPSNDLINEINKELEENLVDATKYVDVISILQDENGNLDKVDMILLEVD